MPEVEDEGRKKTRSSAWTAKETLSTILWVACGAFLILGATRYLAAHTGIGRSIVTGIRGASSVGGFRGRAAAASVGDGRTMRNWQRALASNSALDSNPLLGLYRISWADVQSATEEEADQLTASIFFAQPDAETCPTMTWIPRGRAQKPGGWPICDKVPRPVPSRCHMYSIGVVMPPEFDISGATELGCNVRSFDPNIATLGGLPHGVFFESVGMGGHMALDAKPRIGTLSSIMSYKHEQGRHLYIIKFDCEGCEWESFDQQLKDLGPDAFHDYDIVMIKVNWGSKGYTSSRAAALAALLYNQGFKIYYRHTNGEAGSGKGTESLLSAIETVHGAAAAKVAEANAANLIAVGKAEGTHSEPTAKKLAQDGTVFSVIEYAFVREMALPHKTLLVEREYVKCADPV